MGPAPAAARVMGARGQLRRGFGGRMVSKRSKTGDPKCSLAMSAFQLIIHGMADRAQMSKAHALRKATHLRAAGQELKALHFEHVVGSGGPIGQRARHARALELAQERSRRNQARSNRTNPAARAAATRAAADAARASRTANPAAVPGHRGFVTNPAERAAAARILRSNRARGMRGLEASRALHRENRQLSTRAIQVREHGTEGQRSRQAELRANALSRLVDRRKATRRAADAARASRAQGHDFLTSADERASRARNLRQRRATGLTGLGAAQSMGVYSTRGQQIRLTGSPEAQQHRRVLQSQSTARRARVAAANQPASFTARERAIRGRRPSDTYAEARAGAARARQQGERQQAANTRQARQEAREGANMRPLATPRTRPAFSHKRYGTVEHDVSISPETMAQAKRWFGPHVTEQDLSNLTGAPAGSRVRISHGENSITLNASHPTIRSMSRTIEREGGKLKVYNAIFTRPEEVQGQHRSSGATVEPGRDIFARQIENAHRLGISEVHTSAAGSYGDHTFNGYYTWPRFGYDAEAPSGPLARFKADTSIPQDIREGATHMRHIMATAQGRDWWAVNGHGQHLHFNLTPGSHSLKTLSAYLKHKGTSAEKAASQLRQADYLSRANRVGPNFVKQAYEKHVGGKTASEVRQIARHLGIEDRGHATRHYQREIKKQLRLPA